MLASAQLGVRTQQCCTSNVFRLFVVIGIAGGDRSHRFPELTNH
ncbi:MULTISPECIES: hypothetical protein [unclassified Calothrix]|nr:MULTISPECIES: hypothetical protein [unclassified Calothrix]